MLTSLTKTMREQALEYSRNSPSRLNKKALSLHVSHLILVLIQASISFYLCVSLTYSHTHTQDEWLSHVSILKNPTIGIKAFKAPRATWPLLDRQKTLLFGSHNNKFLLFSSFLGQKVSHLNKRPSIYYFDSKLQPYYSSSLPFTLIIISLQAPHGHWTRLGTLQRLNQS